MSLHNHWSLEYDTFIPENEGVREALCTLCNGYFATRGAGSEATADDFHYPGTYLAGGYNRLKSEKAGREVENEDLVNLPNWLCLNFRIEEGDWFQLKAVELLEYKQELNMKRGTLERTIRFKDAHKRITSLKETRLVHIHHYHLAAISWEIHAENWTGQLEIASALDGCVKNMGVARYRDLNSVHLTPLETGFPSEHGMFLKVETNQSELRIGMAARTKLFKNGELLSIKAENEEAPGYVAQHYTVELEEGGTVNIEKVVALFTSRDLAITECGLEAQQAIQKAPAFEELLRSHMRMWDVIWKFVNFEIELNGLEVSRHPVLILRLHVFHLLQTASLNTVDLDVGIPARGWHGEAYRGHIFWDELFIFPILNLRMPLITRALLKYRYRRLSEARKGAQDHGYLGAMYPWQSGSNGREETQQIHLNPKSGRWIPDNSCVQRHVNAAIAYNVWRYYQVTGDIEFLHAHGAEMILEIARFWASLATYNTELDRYEILGVMGPDEYHDAYPDSEDPGVNNNAYTNVMAVWILSRAKEIMEILPKDLRDELSTRIDLHPDEIRLWDEVSQKMHIVFHEDGIISQFEGYEALKEFPWEEYRNKYPDIQRLDRILEAEGDSPNNYKVSKQADVLMLFYLFSAEELTELFAHMGYQFSQDLIPAHLDYYLHRTSHGSTLSRIVHSWVLSREDRAGSWELFQQSLESDISDIQGGTTAEGIHLGAMAGTVDLMQRCYTGIETRQEILRFNPCLPEQIQQMCMRIHYRGHSIEVKLTQKTLTLKSIPGTAKPIQIGFKEEISRLHTGEERVYEL